jgi:hypothetical protein
MSGGQKVVQATQSGIKFYILECPGDSKLRDRVSRNFEEIFTFVKHSTTLGLIKTTHAVQKTSFPCSIGADDT